MPDRELVVQRLCRSGVVAVVRAKSSEQLVDVARAIAAGGVDCIEITMTTPNALAVIAAVRQQLGDAVLTGVGSVLDAETARAAILAGAEFVVSPIFDPAVLQMTHRYGLPCVPGAFTPTEILNATAAGADMVKVFPAGQLGPGFFKDILGPMPHLKLTPTGGVDLQTAAAFIKAGARTLGVGSALVAPKVVAAGDFATLTATARQFVQVVADARAGK
jgi:2-dehydro-3-deoxyphosphogluconate aldolase / (4S)-4-hydroxy-2-oxoglutarate aldolase